MGCQIGCQCREHERRNEMVRRILSDRSLLVTVDDAFIGFELMQGNFEPARAQARRRHNHISELLEETE